MSARAKPAQKQVVPAWSGVLSRSNTITGHLMCGYTGWKLALTGNADGNHCIQISGSFDGETMGENHIPWAYEQELKERVTAAGYDCKWVGTLNRDGNRWAGDFADFYGNTIALAGVSDAPGVIRLTGRVTAIDWKAIV